MKKILVSIAAAAMFVLVPTKSDASLSVVMLDSNGVFTDAGLSSPVNAGALLLMIWNPTAVYDIPTAGSLTGLTTGSAFGNGYVLYSGFGDVPGGFSPDPDGTTTYVNGNVGGNNINSSLAGVYLYMFESATPLAGSGYTRSSMLTGLNNFDASATPRPADPTIDVAPNAGGSSTTGFQVAAVPEPSTVGLLLVGASLIGLRRFRRS